MPATYDDVETLVQSRRLADQIVRELEATTLSRPMPYIPTPSPLAPEPAPSDEPEVFEEGGGSLASVAKAASIKAERAAIEQTLRQVHWNRRKAAQILGVSYKTLLNKITECGISRAS